MDHTMSKELRGAYSLLQSIYRNYQLIGQYVNDESNGVEYIETTVISKYGVNMGRLEFKDGEVQLLNDKGDPVG